MTLNNQMATMARTSFLIRQRPGSGTPLLHPETPPIRPLEVSPSLSGSVGRGSRRPPRHSSKTRDPSECSMSQLAQEGLSPAHLISQAVLALDGRGDTHTVTSHQHHQGRGAAGLKNFTGRQRDAWALIRGTCPTSTAQHTQYRGAADLSCRSRRAPLLSAEERAKSRD